MSSSGREHPDGVSARSFRRIAGIGALKDLGDGTGEVKSMRRIPAFFVADYVRSNFNQFLHLTL